MLSACSSGPSTVNYVVNFRADNPVSGFSGGYRVGAGAEVSVPASFPQVIQLPSQPSGTAVTARARLSGAGQVTVFITADGETCQSGTATNSGRSGEVAEATVSCTR